MWLEWWRKWWCKYVVASKSPPTSTLANEPGPPAVLTLASTLNVRSVSHTAGGGRSQCTNVAAPCCTSCTLGGGGSGRGVSGAEVTEGARLFPLKAVALALALALALSLSLSRPLPLLLPLQN